MLCARSNSFFSCQMRIDSASSLFGIDLAPYLRRALYNRSLSSSDIINVAQPNHIAELGQLIQSTPLRTLKDYAQWVALNAYAGDLPRPFAREHWEFFGRTLSGTPTQAKRSRVCQSKAIGLMADALSQKYIDVSFSPARAAKAREMQSHVQLAFLRRLPKLSWMTTPDKLKAAEKLTSMILLVGANRPDQMLNYTDVRLNPNTHFENMIELQQYNYRDRLKRLHEKVDRTKFQMPASQVNAYYESEA